MLPGPKMSRKPILRAKRIRKIGRVAKAGPFNVTRSEFDTLVRLINERGETVNEMRREIHSTCRDLSAEVHRNQRELQVQLARIAQMQQEIDALKRR